MKNLSLFGALVLSVSLLAVSSGCKHRAVSPTPIPGMGGPSGGSQSSSGVDNAQPMPTTPPPSGEAIPIDANSRWSSLLNGPHNEDREKFKADTVYFDFDSATIKSGEENKLQDIASYFKGNNTDALMVEGNCDERGTEKYNLSLGERRALAVREYLANLGIDPQRVKTVTFGASRPAESGHDEAAWSKNRRDEMVLVTAK